MTREEAKDLFRMDRDAYGKVKSPLAKIDKIFDEFEQSLQLEDVAKADKQGWLTGYPQFGKFKKNAKVYIYTKEAKDD